MSNKRAIISKVSTLLARLAVVTRLPMMLMALLAPAAAFAEYKLNLQTPNTALGHTIYDLHMVITWICVVIFVVVFGFMFWPASAGLVLYWLTSNVVSIAQQMLLNRTSAPAVAVVVPPKKKK